MYINVQYALKRGRDNFYYHVDGFDLKEAND